ncbi:hypothetical protein [Streptomyces sp. XH2]|uniref:hypothetical protein n=1 Tax=Streptomyces sp. XH2 TaxID=3412483 RepID=UPI003C7A3024
MEFQGPFAHAHLRVELVDLPVAGKLGAESGADLVGVGMVWFKAEIPKTGIRAADGPSPPSWHRGAAGSR